MLALFCVSVFYCIYMIIQEMIRRKNMLETMAATDLKIADRRVKQR